MFPCYPPAIIKAAEELTDKGRNRFLLALDLLYREWLPPPLVVRSALWSGETTGFWRLALTDISSGWSSMSVDLLFSDFWLIQKTSSSQELAPRLWVQSLDEYACREHSLQWSLYVPPAGGGPGGIVSAAAKNR